MKSINIKITFINVVQCQTNCVYVNSNFHILNRKNKITKREFTYNAMKLCFQNQKNQLKIYLRDYELV